MYLGNIKLQLHSCQLLLTISASTAMTWMFLLVKVVVFHHRTRGQWHWCLHFSIPRFCSLVHILWLHPWPCVSSVPETEKMSTPKALGLRNTKCNILPMIHMALTVQHLPWMSVLIQSRNSLHLRTLRVHNLVHESLVGPYPEPLQSSCILHTPFLKDTSWPFC